MRMQSSSPADAAKQKQAPDAAGFQQQTAQQRPKKFVHGIHQLNDRIAAHQLAVFQHQRQTGPHDRLVQALNGIQPAQHGQGQRKQGQVSDPAGGKNRKAGGEQVQQRHQTCFAAAVGQGPAGQHSGQGREHGQCNDTAIEGGGTALAQEHQRQGKPQSRIAEQGNDLPEDDENKVFHGTLLFTYGLTVCKTN